MVASCLFGTIQVQIAGVRQCPQWLRLQSTLVMTAFRTLHDLVIGQALFLRRDHRVLLVPANRSGRRVRHSVVTSSPLPWFVLALGSATLSPARVGRVQRDQRSTALQALAPVIARGGSHRRPPTMRALRGCVPVLDLSATRRVSSAACLGPRLPARAGRVRAAPHGSNRTRVRFRS